MTSKCVTSARKDPQKQDNTLTLNAKNPAFIKSRPEFCDIF